MGRPGGDSRAQGMQIAMHMSQMPEGLNGSEGRRRRGNRGRAKEKGFDQGERTCNTKRNKINQK